MMGPIVYLQNHAGRIKRCSEKRLGCNTSEDNTAGCCAIVACRYCVTWTEYGETGVADMTNDGDGIWMATPGGVAFVMYWERDQYTDDCELVVTFDGEEVYRKSCYEGQSCRDSSDEVEVSLTYLTGTLRWAKDLKRPLPTVRDYETNCIRQMCSGCDCTCECLCVVITNDYPETVASGEICDTAYDCDPPMWSGTVGEYTITIAMDEDCAISATVNGASVSLSIAAYTSVCDNFTATIVLDDGNTITLTCKECTCTPDAELCCPDRGCPGDGTPNPFPTNLTLTIEDPDADGCWDMTGTLTLGACPEINYIGTAEATCTWCGNTYDIKVSVVLTCSTTGGWLLRFVTPAPDLGDCSDVTPTNVLLNQFSCDPILLQVENECLTCASLICQGDPGPIPMPYPHAPFCGLTITVFEAA